MQVGDYEQIINYDWPNLTFITGKTLTWDARKIMMILFCSQLPPLPPPRLPAGLFMCHFCFDFILFELTGCANFDFN